MLCAIKCGYMNLFGSQKEHRVEAMGTYWFSTHGEVKEVVLGRFGA